MVIEGEGSPLSPSEPETNLPVTVETPPPRLMVEHEGRRVEGIPDVAPEPAVTRLPPTLVPQPDQPSPQIKVHAGIPEAKTTYHGSEYYIGGSNYPNYEWMRKGSYWRSIVEVAQRLPNRKQVLDLGCAFGFALEQLAPYFKHLVGADVSKAALAHASTVVPQAELHELDLEQHEIPGDDTSYDLILALDVLEHLALKDRQDPQAHAIEVALKKIKPKLAPGGRLVISVPVTDLSLISRIIWNHLDHDRSHVSKPTMQQLIKSIENAGLEIENQRYFFPLATPLGTWKVPIPTNIEMVLKLRESPQPPTS